MCLYPRAVKKARQTEIAEHHGRHHRPAKTRPWQEGFHPPRLWKGKWLFSKESFDNRPQSTHFNTMWRLGVFLTRREQIHTRPLPHQEPMDLIKVKGVEMSGVIQERLTEAQRKGCWHWRVPPAGNATLSPCPVSLDCRHKQCSSLMEEPLRKRERGQERSTQQG